jgi:hypothetical protein
VTDVNSLPSFWEYVTVGDEPDPRDPLDSAPTGWLIATTNPQDGFTYSAPTAWAVTTTSTTPGSTGVFVVSALDVLVESDLFLPSDL